MNNNNPFAGFRPATVINQIRNNPEIMKNPMIQNVFKMYDAHDSDGLNNMANNLFKNNGQDYSEYTKNLKQQLGFK